MLDFNPYIDGTFKMLSLQGGDRGQILLDSTTTWEDMTNRYNRIWMLDPTLKICDNNGKVAIGWETIETNFQLPQYLVDVHHDKAPASMIMSYSPDFFNEDCFVG